MSEQHPTPQWFTPSGGTTTAPRHEGAGAPTTPMPVTYATPPPPMGPLGPLGQPAPAGPRPEAGQARGAGQLTAVAVLAALPAPPVAPSPRPTAGRTTPPRPPAPPRPPSSAATPRAPVKQGSAPAPDWTATASVVSPSVVSITATLAQGGGQGSGVIIDKTGHVLTNNHVVSGAQKLTVTLADGRTYDAEVARHRPLDRPRRHHRQERPERPRRPIAIGNSDKIAVGDPVMAVGNPLGLAGTVTTGIVSALNRPVTTEAESRATASSDPNGQAAGAGETVVTNAIQTSAAINPGNSGGACVNRAAIDQQGRQTADEEQQHEEQRAAASGYSTMESSRSHAGN